MVVEFRLYRRFDADLIALCRANYPVSAMIREAVTGYANGRPVHYYIDELTDFDLNDDKTVRSRFVVPNSDYKTCNMLKKVKYRCRNAFVKTVLRNSLIQQNITCFFVDDSLNYLKNVNDNFKNVYAFPNVTSCSTIKTAPRAVAVADGIYVSSDNRTRRMKKRNEAEQGYINTQPPATGTVQYPNMQAPYTDNYQQYQSHDPHTYTQNHYNNVVYQPPFAKQSPQQVKQQYSAEPVYDHSAQYQMPPIAQTPQYNASGQPPAMLQPSGINIMQQSTSSQYTPPGQNYFGQHFGQQMSSQYQIPDQSVPLHQHVYSTQQELHTQGYTSFQSSQPAEHSTISDNAVHDSDVYVQNTEMQDAYDEPINRTDKSTSVGLAENQQLMNLFDSL